MAPPVLVATVGAATANTYITQADATTYFSSRANATSWTGASSDNKDIALLMATDLLDREKWKGTKGSTPTGALTQALAWPRRWAPTLEYDNEPSFVGFDDVWVDLTLAYYSELAIPGPIVDATCELALEILKAGTTDPFASLAYPWENVRRKTVDVLTTEWFGPEDRSSGLGRFPSVIALIAHLLRAAGTTTVDRV